MAFTVKNWQDEPSTSTPLNAAALEDLETRLSDYADSLTGGGSGSGESVIDVTAAPYNAAADNVTDDTAAIQAALDDAQASLFGNPNDNPSRIVQLPPARLVVQGTLTIPSNTMLRGHGPGSTYLYRGSGGTGTAIIKIGGGTVEQVLADFGVISDDSAVDCIDLTGSNTNPSILADGRVTIRDVVCVGGNRGILAPDGTEHHFTRVACYRQYADGFNVVATDCFFEGCTAAASGQANATVSTTLAASGFKIAGANSRLYGCKAFGQLGTSNSWGFAVSGAGRHLIAACEAQDCQGDGYSLAGNYPSVATGCIADSCGGVGYRIDSAGQTLSGCTALNRGGSYTMIAAVASGNAQTVIRGLVTTGVRRIYLSGGAYTQDFYAGADIDKAKAGQSVAYAATVTPDPYLGGEVRIGAFTGNITINKPTCSTELGDLWPMGMRVGFWLTQDATGGRTVTFNAQYKTTAAIPTTANSVTFVEFSWDGTNWREASRATT